jgi:hypothetical protein
LSRGLDVGDDDLAEGAAAVGLAADRIMAVGEPIGEVLVETPDVGMIVVREDAPALDHLQNLGGKGFCDRGEMGIEGR